MRVDAFDFVLPPERIALAPANPRDSARMLVVGADGGLTDSHVRDLPNFLRRGDALVVNDTRVIAARLEGVRVRGDGDRFDRGDADRARRRLPVAGARASGQEAQGRRAHPLRRVERKHGLPSRRARRGGGGQRRSRRSAAALRILPARRWMRRSSASARPLAALHRLSPRPVAERRADYQTMFAAKPGAVAAPTAGLHFTPALVQRLAEHGVELHRVTLHVGAGTFAPVRVEDTRDHRMHSEWGSIDAATAEALNAVTGGRGPGRLRRHDLRAHRRDAPPTRTGGFNRLRARPISSSPPDIGFAASTR